MKTSEGVSRDHVMKPLCDKYRERRNSSEEILLVYRNQEKFLKVMIVVKELGSLGKLHLHGCKSFSSMGSPFF